MHIASFTTATVTSTITGFIPNLQHVRAHHVGNLPDSWSRLSNLQQLDFSVNHITGSLVDAWGSNGSWPVLTRLDASGNQLTGVASWPRRS